MICSNGDICFTIAILNGKSLVFENNRMENTATMSWNLNEHIYLCEERVRT